MEADPEYQGKIAQKIQAPKMPEKVAAIESLANLPTAEMPAVNEDTRDHAEFLQFDTERKVREADVMISELVEKISSLQTEQEILRQHKETGWQTKIRSRDEQIIPLKEQLNSLRTISWTASQIEVRKNFLAQMQSDLGKNGLQTEDLQKQTDFIHTLEAEILADQLTLEHARFLPENLNVDTQTIFDNLESAEKLLNELRTSLTENPPATKAERFTVLGQIRDLENRIPILRGEVARRVKEQNPDKPSLRSLSPLEKPEMLVELSLRDTPSNYLETKLDIKEGLITKLRDQIELADADTNVAQLEKEAKQAETDLAAIKGELKRRGVAVTEFVYQPSRWAVAEKARRPQRYAETAPQSNAVPTEKITTLSHIEAVAALPGAKHTREMAKVIPIRKPKPPTLTQKISGFFRKMFA